MEVYKFESWNGEVIEFLNSTNEIVTCEISGGNDNGCCNLYAGSVELDREDICDYILSELNIYGFDGPTYVEYKLTWDKQDCSFSGTGGEYETAQVEISIDYNIYVPKFERKEVELHYNENGLSVYNENHDVIIINEKEVVKAIESYYDEYDDLYIDDIINLNEPDEEDDYFYIYHGFSLWGTYNKEETNDVYIKL